MSTNANGKRARDELIVAALATGSTYDEAAKKAGVSRATVARRMSEWEFRAHVAEERERIVDGVRGTLVAQALAAADVLAELAAKAESETVRVAAATRILDYALRRRPGFDTFGSAEVTGLVNELVELALAHIPDEAHEAYLRRVRAVGAPG
jgi:hypothetical protein